MGLIRHDKRDVFISYARDDNVFWDEAVLDFQKSLKKKLEAEVRDHFDLSSSNDADIFVDSSGLPTNGSLSEELKNAVTSSCFLLIFIGRAYPRSDWCGQELGHFINQFQGDRTRALERTFLLVLDKRALKSAWGAFLDHPERPIFEPLYDDSTGKPIPMRAEDDEGIMRRTHRINNRLNRIVETMVARSESLMNEIATS